ncbi:general negative regulator of transcription subunit 3 isoform X2 [Nymphaea colorata]|uniref:general negative regulator of transcription subunit 3 isoform X2 n=1 Tax=Nymphaea colorata TaxID=210225 RepID=UPI00129D6996|nr:general negative regulator of transcription subunit 3 isoform X2 [Nymphaea colorata]
MGASRKLQGEIDRVLKKVQEGVEVFDSIWNKVYDTDNANQKEKFEADLKKEIKKLQRYRDQIKTWIQSSEIKDKKVSASYEQALLDARKLIEREMERFKVCEKETKTKAFSKEGLGQQPKTDPKEKAKAETRDWLNNVVGELESQIDYFEADIEGLSVKKGKSRPPRLAHLEASITRHKAHIMKLELILRLLDNDELSPDQVNDVKDFLEDYVERNQEDFDEFDDVDELYISLPLEKVEALEDLVAISPGIAKAVVSTSVTTGALGLKTPAPSGTQLVASVASSNQQGIVVPDQTEETASQDSSSDTAPRTPPSNKSSAMATSASATASSSNVASGVNTAANGGGNILPRPMGGPSTSGILSTAGSMRSVLEASTATAPPSPASLSTPAKEDDVGSFPGRRPSPSLTDVGLGRGVSRGPVAGVTTGQTSVSVPLTSGSVMPGSGTLGAVPAVSDLTKRNLLVTDERIGGGVTPPMVSPLATRVLLQQTSKTGDGSASTELSSSESGTVGGRVFNPAAVAGVQWRPHSATSFQSQNETFRGRTEIAPDQREKFLLRLQQVQQGHNNLLGVSHLSGVSPKQFSTQQQSSLLQQLNAQSSSLSSQPGLGLGLQGQGLSAMAPVSQQTQATIQQASPQHVLLSPIAKDAESTSGKVDEIQQQQKLTDDSSMEPVTNAVQNKSLTGEEDLKSPYPNDSPVGGSGSLSEANQLQRDSDFSPGQPLPSPQSSSALGVIGRRSASDLGAIGDNLGGSSATPGHDHSHNLLMLDSAYFKLPQAKDSERPKNYVPRHPAVTPASYPQVQAPIIDNPAFWERVAADNFGTDTLFFAFYFQQNTYQQYLAARELKKQSWRYHKKYNTWFQRHEEPKVTTDDYEQGTYVYFDFHITNDDYGNQQQQGWCQRIKTEFTFEYSYLEDELVV